MATLRARRGGSRGAGDVRRLDGGAAAARVVQLIASAVAAVLVVGILLVLLGANQQNDLVGAVLDAGRWLAGPFENLFELDSRKAEIAVNWGIAAVVYVLIAQLVARLLAR